MSSPWTVPTRTRFWRAEAARGLEGGVATAFQVYATRVAHHPDSALHAHRKDVPEHRDEIAGIALGWVEALRLLEDRHGDFGQIVHHHVVDRTARHLLQRRLRTVAPESLATGDAHHALAHIANSSGRRQGRR
jgi:hypothetical protein